jgi:hypothetical protein
MSGGMRIDLNLFNNFEVIRNLDSGALAKLAYLAINAEQLDMIASAINMSAEVVTAIINNAKVKLQELRYETFMQLAKLSTSSDELCSIVEGLSNRVSYFIQQAENASK